MGSRSRRREYHYDRETEQVLEHARNVGIAKDFSDSWSSALTLFHEHLQPVARVYLKWNLGEMFTYPVISHPEPWSTTDFVKVLHHSRRTFEECGIQSAFGRHVSQLETLIKEQGERDAAIDDALRITAVIRSIMKLFPDEVPTEAEKEVTSEERVEAEKQLHKGKKAIKEQYNKIRDEIEDKNEAQHRHHRSEREDRKDGGGWGGEYGLRHERSRSYDKGEEPYRDRDDYQHRHSRDERDSSFREERHGRREYDSRAGGDRHDSYNDRSSRGSRSFHEKGYEEEEDRRGRGWSDHRSSKRSDHREKYSSPRRGDHDSGDRFEGRKGGWEPSRQDSYDRNYSPPSAGWNAHGGGGGEDRRHFDDDRYRDDYPPSKRDAGGRDRGGHHWERDHYSRSPRHDMTSGSRGASNGGNRGGQYGHDSRGYDADQSAQYNASGESGLSHHARMQLPRRPPNRSGPHGPSRTASGDGGGWTGGRSETLGRSTSDVDRRHYERQTSREREDAPFHDRGSPPGRKYSERHGFGHQHSGRKEFERSQESRQREAYDRNDRDGGRNGGGDRTWTERGGGWGGDSHHSSGSRDREKGHRHGDRGRQSDGGSGWGMKSSGGSEGWGGPPDRAARKSDTKPRRPSPTPPKDNPWGAPPDSGMQEDNPWGAPPKATNPDDNPWGAIPAAETQDRDRDTTMKDEPMSKQSNPWMGSGTKEDRWSVTPERSDNAVDNPWGARGAPMQPQESQTAPPGYEQSAPRKAPNAEPQPAVDANPRTVPVPDNPWGAIPDPAAEGHDNPWGAVSVPPAQTGDNPWGAAAESSTKQEENWGGETFAEEHKDTAQGPSQGTPMATDSPWQDPANMNLNAWSTPAPIWSAEQVEEQSNSNSKAMFSAAAEQEKRISATSDLMSASGSGRSSGSKKIGPPPGFESKVYRNSSE